MNLRPETVKESGILLEGNTGSELLDISLGNVKNLLDLTPKAKINKLDCFTLKFLHSIRNHQQNEQETY